MTDQPFPLVLVGPQRPRCATARLGAVHSPEQAALEHGQSPEQAAGIIP